MSELYWITVLGKLSGTANAILIVLLCIFVLFITISPIISDICDIEFKSLFKNSSKYIKYIIVTTFISGTISIFVPTTNELYAIYGFGTVLDYVQNNKEIQKIPDNCIKAINDYLESINKE